MQRGYDVTQPTQGTAGRTAEQTEDVVVELREEAVVVGLNAPLFQIPVCNIVCRIPEADEIVHKAGSEITIALVCEDSFVQSDHAIAPCLAGPPTKESTRVGRIRERRKTEIENPAAQEGVFVGMLAIIQSLRDVRCQNARCAISQRRLR